MVNNKKSNRTKGNVQSSSSSRAAQLLSNKQHSTGGGLIGFTSSTSTAQDFSQLDPRISAALKKLNKKEAVTKQKALAEILEALTESDVESCLHFWCRCYPKISIENDRKTRELSQQVHSKIVQYAGRNLAPQLGLLMGAWLEGTCDCHNAASKIAAGALAKCFNETKLREALRFCEKSVLKHIKERLSSSPSTLSDMKTTDPFDADEKYSRVIGSTLRSLLYILSILQEERSTDTDTFLHDAALWKLGRSKDRHIRGHVFDFISKLCDLKLRPLPATEATDDTLVTSPDTLVTSHVTSLQVVPVACCKTVVYQLNQCHRDVSAAQWRALQSVVLNVPDLFWSEVSEPDLRGQLVDSVKSKALLGGVLESVYDSVPVLVIAIYNKAAETSTENASSWLESVLSATLKCLNQCKQMRDKCHVIRVMCYLSSRLWSENTSALIVSNMVCLINGLSSDVLPNNFTEHFFSFLSSSSVTTQHLIDLLLAIKQNNNKIQNTLVLLRVILSVVISEDCAEFLRMFGEVLAGRFEKEDGEDVVYVSVILQNYPELETYFCNKLASEQRDIIDTLFLPLFTASPSEQITSLCAIIIPFLNHHSTDLNLSKGHIRELILSSPHPTLALYSMLQQSLRLQSINLIPTPYIIESFPHLVTDNNQISLSVINFLCQHIDTLPSLQSIIEEHVLSLFTSTDRTTLSHVNWDYLLNAGEDATSQSIVQNLIDLSLVSFDDPSIGTSLRKAFTAVGSSAARLHFLERVVRRMSGENVSYYGDLVVEVFKEDECEVVLYLVNSGILTQCHQSELCSTAVIIDMYERYGVIVNNNITPLTSPTSLLDLFLFCHQFVTKSNLHLTDSMSSFVYFLLSSEYILRITNPSFLKHSGFFQTFIDCEWEDYSSIVTKFLQSNDLTLIYFLKDLEILNIPIKWEGVKFDSVSTMFILNLAINLKSDTFSNALSARARLPDIQLWESLLAKTQLLPYDRSSEIIAHVSDECLDGQITDLLTLGCVFKTFSFLLKSPVLSDEDTDFLTCSTATILQYGVDLVDAENWANHFELLMFVKELRSLYFLFHDTAVTAREFLEKHPEEAGSYRFEKLSEEWIEFFEPGIQDLILVLLDKLCHILQGDTLCEDIVGEVAAISLLTPTSSVQTYVKYVTKLGPQDISFDVCFNHLMTLHQLTNSYIIQRAIFNIMLHCQNLYAKDHENEEEVEEEEDRQFESPPSLYLTSLLSADLSSVSSVDFEPLLVRQIHVWCLLLNHEARIDSELLREHVSYLKSKQIVFNFLKHLAHFLPLHSKKCKIELLENVKGVTKLEQHQIASTCFLKIATIYPALLRDWWKKQQDKELSMNVERFISSFISPHLIRLETTINVEESDTLQVKSRPVVREVVATYTMDDISADLVINLAANHPLVPPSVSCERQVGVPVSTWRSWMLQITNMFSHQNCSIVEGLQHWKKNMDKQFEGVESCLICFSVVQGPNKSLPKLRCKTCKKKFHSACLYKWFSTSGKSTCPMCRSSFQHTSGLRRRLQVPDDGEPRQHHGI